MSSTTTTTSPLEEGTDFYRDLLHSLPPLDMRDRTRLHQEVRKLPGCLLTEPDMEACTQTWTCALSNATTTTNTSALATSLETAWTNAQQVYRDQGITARWTVTPSGEDDNGLVVRTYVEHVDPHNWGTGSWTGEWTIVPSSSDTASVGGTVSTHVYYFEDSANVHKQASREFSSTTVSSNDNDDSDGLVQAIVQQIKAWEKEFYVDLADEDAVMTSLKQIRRILPITRTRMKWYVCYKSLYLLPFWYYSGDHRVFRKE
jgi:hypothetical protein